MSQAAIYVRIKNIQREKLVTREEAANILATELGIPVYDILSELELRKLRELQSTRGKVTSMSPLKSREITSKRTRTEEKSIAPNRLYDLLNFHPRIVKASRSQFKSGHYTDAIFNAFRCIEVFAKEKSGIDGRGASLMHKIFNEKNPIIRLNEMRRDFEIDEQAGFRFIYVGAMTGIRNPKAHAEIQQRDPYRTLEYLSLASLLAKRLDEGEKVHE